MTGHIFIDREIGVQTTPESVRKQIDQTATEYEVHINSVGGDVYDGVAIGSILRALGKPTTAIIDGMCASIATYISSCCDKVVMTPHGDFMIHDPTASIKGRAEDLRKGAGQLERIKSDIIERYMTKVARKGVTRDQLDAMMANETSMSAVEALKYGFVDEIGERLKAVAKWDLSKLKNEDMMTKEEAKGMFEALGKKIDALFIKAKNAVEITLEDGTVVMSSAEDASAVVGSTLTDETGAPVAPGQLVTAEGVTIVVGEGGVVESATAAADKKEPEESEEMKALKAERDALKAELESVKAEKEAVTKASAEAEKKFQNAFKEVKEELNKLQNETFGDKTVVSDAPEKIFKNQADERPFDPMAETLGRAFVTSRPNHNRPAGI